MSHSTSYFPRQITERGRVKRWVSGSYIGNVPAAARHATKLRLALRRGDYSEAPRGATIRRFHCNVNVYV